jgi:hypothetical protein
LDQVFLDFVNDRAFEGRAPSREQVARAWAWAKFQKAEETAAPNHAEIVSALKKLFPQFKDPRPISKGPHSGK